MDPTPITPPARWPWPADDPRRFRRVLTARDFPLLRDDDGRPLCRWCGEAVKSPRRTLCSASCDHEISLRTSTSYLARQVFQRDRGVCSACGRDTQKPNRVDRRIKNLHHWSRFRGIETPRWVIANEHGLREMFRTRYGGGWHYRSADARSEWRWEADHVIPVSEGGGGCGLDGMRTLCLPCHGKETGALRRRLNAGRNPQLQILDTPDRERFNLPGGTRPGVFFEGRARR